MTDQSGPMEPEPAAVAPPADRAGLRQRIADVLAAADGWKWVTEADKTRSSTYRSYQTRADAVLAVLTAPDQQGGAMFGAAEIETRPELNVRPLPANALVADETVAPDQQGAVTPPPALTEEGRLRSRVNVLEDALKQSEGLAKVGARCMRTGHQGLIEHGRVTIEGHRFALSVKLDLGTGASWDAIYERVAGLRRLAGETQQDDAERRVYAWAQTIDTADAGQTVHIPGVHHSSTGPETTAVVVSRDDVPVLRAMLADSETQQDHVVHPDVQVWPLARVLTEVRCGSGDWSWDEEWADLDRRHAATGYLEGLKQQIRENGITMPVLIGSDGRLWDGHHRLRIAVRLGIGYVPVEITRPSKASLDACPTPESHNWGCGCPTDQLPLHAESGVDTPGCDCGHDGMGSKWHARDCVWLATMTVPHPDTLAREAQQGPAPGGEAHPPHDSWLVEWRAKGGDWEVAYPTHDHSKALHRLERGRQDAPDWQWRLVRETTSYAVDAAESSGQPDTNQEA